MGRFEKIKTWWQTHKPTKRRLIQVYAALLVNANIKGFFKGNIYQGGSKYLCVPGLNCYSCPGAVGACPLGALQNALAQSGTRTPFYVFGIIVLFGLLLGRAICGFLCPVGLGQELLYKIKTPKLKKSRFTRILSYFKYVLLAVLVVALPLLYSLSSVPLPAFCKYICPAGTFGGALGLLIHPGNAELFETLGPLFTWKFCLMIAICVACVFIFRAFCRFLCPLGAIYGFFNRVALLGVKLDKNSCTDCGLCVAHCKMDVKRVGDHECINCGECIDVCPAKAISWKGSKLFVHQNAVEAVPSGEQDRPLAAFLNAEPAPAAAALCSAEGAQAVKGGSAQTVPEEAPAPKKNPRGKSFYLRLAAWGAAIAVLAGALVYYNFFDASAVGPSTPGVETGNKVGQLCPDLEFASYFSDEPFAVAEQRGKIVILNFWATWCTPCVEEIPHFERIAEEFSSEVTVAFIHARESLVTEPVVDFIEKHGWSHDTAQFVQDADEGDAYTLLGGRISWPITVILDREGVIAVKHMAPVSYEELLSDVTTLTQT